MAGMRVVVVACDDRGNIDLPDLRAKAAAHRDELSCLMVTYPSTHGVFERQHPRDLRDRPRARRPGLHGRRQHERAGRADEPGGDWRGRVPSEPAQDVCDSARRRRARHGADRRGRASRAVPAGALGHSHRRRAGDLSRVRGAVGQREHPADLVRLRPDARRPGRDRRDARRDAQRELHQGAPRVALPGALRGRDRPRRARAHLRPAAVQGEDGHRRAGRREAARWTTASTRRRCRSPCRAR